jgi:hypothetical protein
MTDIPSFEIPAPVRELAEQNVVQARAAYEQFMQMAQQAQAMMTQSQGALAANAMDIQNQAMKFAEQNVNANFEFAAKLARAKDMAEYMEIQKRYAETQLKSFADQAQELGRKVAATAQMPKT